MRPTVVFKTAVFKSSLLSALLICVATLVFGFGCEDEKLAESERQEFHKVVNTGVSHPDDAYVRAETLRVLELLDDSRLNEFARGALEDDSPMVRTVALRVLLATNAEGGRAAALNAFTNAQTNAEKRAVLIAALEHGSPPLKRQITARARRTDDKNLRRMAFEQGPLARVDRALAEDNEDYLRRTLYPELGQFISLDTPLMAAMALKKFLEIGQEERAERMIEIVSDGGAELNDRLTAARILAGARAKPAASIFREIIEKHDRVMADDRLGVPRDAVDPKLLRAAVLGSVATGDTDYVKRAQDYLKKADSDESIEVLEALGGNPSEDAGISLKIAMQDAREPVRYRAIELYQQREDAEPGALIKAMKNAPHETRERLSDVLISRFRDAWVKHLKTALLRNSTVDQTLSTLRDLIVTDEEREVLKAVRGELKKLSKTEDGERAAVASFLLAQVSSPDERERLVAEKLDASTRYAYLEFLVRTDAEGNIPTFRKYFYDDRFAIRLMSAAGLWRAFGGPEFEKDGSGADGEMVEGEATEESEGDGASSDEESDS